jgi:hypothetical protein
MKILIFLNLLFSSPSSDGIVLQIIETNGPKELGLENRKFKKTTRF